MTAPPLVGCVVCSHRCSASTLLTCRDQQNQSSGSATLMTQLFGPQELGDSINSYIAEITAYLNDSSLLISSPKSSVTLFTLDTHQAKTKPNIFIEDSQLPLVQCSKILGIHLDTCLLFNKHSNYVAKRVSSINNILKALVGIFWGQQKGVRDRVHY